MRLPPGEVHVWWLLEGRNGGENGDEFDEDDDGLFARGEDGEVVGASPLLEAAARRLLPEEEGAAAANGGGASPSSSSSSQDAASRARALASRVLVRWALGRYAGVHPSALPLSRGGNGKPLLLVATSSMATTGDDDGGGEVSLSSSSSSAAPSCCSLLEFNVTHTEGLLGVAVSAPGHAVGLDAELWSRSPRAGALSLARRRFARAEAEALAALPEGPRRDAEFNALWTLKEAALKATGRGIGGALGAALKGAEFELVSRGGGREGGGGGASSSSSLSSPRSALEAAVPGLPIPRGESSSSSSSSSSNSNSQSAAAVNPLTLLGPREIRYKGGAGGGGEGGAEEEEKEPAASAWSFVLLAPTPRHVAAICVASSSSSSSSSSPSPSPPPPLRVRAWRADVSAVGEEEEGGGGDGGGGGGKSRRGFGSELPRGAAALACSVPPTTTT